MYTFLKRFLDLMLAAMCLFLFAPIFAIIALLIKQESEGPILYKQLRLGKDGIEFYHYRFRTLKIFKLNDISKLVNKKISSDPRVTRIGRLLRITSLDNLPSLLNILKGDMSFVGPCPVLAYESRQYPDLAKERLKCKPGLTGLWQVYGKKDIDYEEMIRMDIEYVRKQSILLDLKILIKTPFVTFDMVRPKETEKGNATDK